MEEIQGKGEEERKGEEENGRRREKKKKRIEAIGERRTER